MTSPSPIFLYLRIKLYRHIQCHEVCKLLQYAMTALQTWSRKWLLNLNINKCCIISYGRLVDKSMRYTLVDHNNHEAALKRCDKVKDLGVWFDE